MAAMAEDSGKGSPEERFHDYHAEAHVLSGDLQRPVEQKIERHSPVVLKDRRGGHLTRFADKVNIEGLISFASGHTRVSGSRSLKHKGWLTLSTATVQGLNVFEIITADRLVSQVSTDHPYKEGHEPQVSFLGTQFQNLQVSGFRAELTLNFGICGERPADDRPYFRSPKFLDSVKTQTETFAKASGLPSELKAGYDEKLKYIETLIKACDKPDNGLHKPVTCSLVEKIGSIPIAGVQSFGNVLLIPEFGSVTLGEIEVSEVLREGYKRPAVHFELTCVRMKLGCVGQGTVAGATTKSNGQTYP